MKRRYLLAGATTGMIAVVGCLNDRDFSESSSDPTRPAEIIESDFETRVKIDTKMGEGPEITVNRDESTVIVEGVGQYGSSSCGYLNDRDPHYEPENAELNVRVTARQDRSDGDAHCEDDLAASSYRFVIRFDEGVPARIEASHPFEYTSTKEP